MSAKGPATPVSVASSVVPAEQQVAGSAVQDSVPATPSFLEGSLPEFHGGIDDLVAEDRLVPVEPNPKKTKYTLVEKSDASATSQGQLVNVLQAVPDVLEKEAVRLTDNKQFKYPWERGRLAKVFGFSPLSRTVQPRIQPSPTILRA